MVRFMFLKEQYGCAGKHGFGKVEYEIRGIWIP